METFLLCSENCFATVDIENQSCFYSLCLEKDGNTTRIAVTVQVPQNVPTIVFKKRLNFFQTTYFEAKRLEKKNNFFSAEFFGFLKFFDSQNGIKNLQKLILFTQ